MATTILTTALIIFFLSGCGSESQNTSEAVVMEETVEESAETSETEKAAETEEDEKTQETEANVYYEEGKACLYGLNGTEISLEQAYNNFAKAKDMGNQDANFYLGVLADWQGYPEQDFAKAKTYYEACENNPYAQLSLGFFYYYGQGVETDAERGKELFQSVIDQGCAEGYLGTAGIAYDEQDYATAFEYYNKVLEGKEQVYLADALRSIGNLYYSALEWWEKAADLGNSFVMCDIAYVYEEGNGVEQDFGKAMEWYEKAADLGNADAMNNIGWMYGNGNGVEQDLSMALEWYEKAAALGSESAEQNVAYIKSILQ